MEKKWSVDDNVLERLDKCLVSLEWLHYFPSAKLNHYIFTTSDHCIEALSYLTSQIQKAHPFKFEKMWCLGKVFDVIVKKTWCSRFEGSFMYRLVPKCNFFWKDKSAKFWNTDQGSGVKLKLGIN